MNASAPLGQHLRRINRIGLVVAVAVVAVFVMIGSYVAGVLMLTSTHRSMARVLAETATAAVAFDDRTAARELLQALRNTPEIRSAALYGRDGALFASYASGAFSLPRALPADLPEESIDTDHVLVSEVVRVPSGPREAAPARLVLDVGLDALHERVFWNVLAALGVGMLALLLSERLLRGLNDRLLVPVGALTALMRRVSEQGDYGVRAQPSTIDELQVLGEGFNAMLAQIADRDARVQQALQLAEEASRAKGDFLATMSHEIRTPLNGVLGMTELLMGSDITPRQRAWATAARASGAHLLAIINDILDFSKIEAGQLELAAEDFDVLDTVEDALAMFAEQAERKGLELVVSCASPAGGLRMRGDALRFRQVVVNLVSNAVKFTAHGSVVVALAVDDAALAGAGAGAGARVRVAVSDTGVGIPLEAQGRIFEQFSQADGSTTRRFGGTGLGLAICSRILRRMDGEIAVESVPGRGSTFRVSVPFMPALDAPPVPRAVRAPPGLNVLVADGDGARRAGIVVALRSADMRVWTASDTPAALRALTAALDAGTPIDALLVHRVLPDEDGLALARSVGTALGTRAPPIVLIDSNYTGAPAAELAAAGIACGIGKPVRRGELFGALARVRERATPAVDAPVAEPGGDAVAAGAALATTAHILVAEDNPVNQEVACAMLEAIGATVTVVADGALAVERVRAGDIDLVLMDCQMPEMDGYEATRRIRAWERATGARDALPIVALTANARADDRDACIAAGMSDYLAKPFSADDLTTALARNLRAGRGARPTAHAPATV